jgi:hypothetical protein
MKVVILYRPNSEHGREVETFIHDYQDRHGNNKLEILDVDSRDGGSTASLYDIMQYPAILIMRNDGSIIKSWQGEMLPLMDEIASYTYSGE